MKTFDEAVDAILEKDPALLGANFTTAAEYIQNDKWATVIAQMATHMMEQTIEEGHDGSEAVAIACNHFHSAFQFGVLVGMEMEKER